MEIWKEINGYEGLYEVSNWGNIKSNNFRGSGFSKIKKLNVRKSDGYVTVNLCKNGTTKTMRVHRLVAEAFIPNPKMLPQVNHKDENKTNNSVENLEWCDSKYNINYSVKLHPKRKKYSRGPRKWFQRVKQIDLDTGEVIREYSCAKEVGYVIGNHNTTPIVNCCFGKSKKAYGYKWEFCE